MAIQEDLALCAVEVKKDFELPTIKPIAPSPASPIKIGIGGKVSVKGTATPPNSHSKAAFSMKDGQLKNDVEESIKTEFGQIKFKGQVKPGEISKLSMELGDTGRFWTLEFAANADYSKPISISVKWPHLIQLESVDLRVAGFAVSEHWKFTGSLDPQLDINVAMNEDWPGWGPVLRAAAQQTRTFLQSGASAIRGVYFAGELGTVTTVGAVAIAASAGLCGVAWIGFGMYQCGKALREGRGMAVRYSFCNGYAKTLAELTSDSPDLKQAEVAPLLNIDWKGSLAGATADYVNGPGNFSLADNVEKLGNAAILQDVDRYIKTRGRSQWDGVKKKHQMQYGTRCEARTQRYLSILYGQVENKVDTLGVAFD